jgi:hypothetical protein
MRSFRRAPQGVIVHRTNYLPPEDVTAVGGLPVTTPARTLLDLGGLVSSKQGGPSPERRACSQPGHQPAARRSAPPRRDQRKAGDGCVAHPSRHLGRARTRLWIGERSRGCFARGHRPGRTAPTGAPVRAAGAGPFVGESRRRLSTRADRPRGRRLRVLCGAVRVAPRPASAECLRKPRLAFLALHSRGSKNPAAVCGRPGPTSRARFGPRQSRLGRRCPR